MKIPAAKKIKLLILIVVASSSCNKWDNAQPATPFDDLRISIDWSVKAPINAEKVDTADWPFQTTFRFNGDSMQLKTSIETVDLKEAAETFKYAFRAEIEDLPVGLCMGDYRGYYKFHNFVNLIDGLSGLILDLDENGRKSVFFTVVHAGTGNKLNLLFESLAPEKYRLVHEIARNISYIP